MLTALVLQGATIALTRASSAAGSAFVGVPALATRRLATPTRTQMRQDMDSSVEKATRQDASGVPLLRTDAIPNPLELVDSLVSSSLPPTTSGRRRDPQLEASFAPLPTQQPPQTELFGVPIEGLLWKGVLVVMTFLWASNFPVIKLALGGGEEVAAVEPSVYAAGRFSIAALALSPFLLGAPIGALLGGAECGLYIALGYIGQALALATTTANKAAFICSLQVVFVVLVSSVLKRHLDRSALGAALLAVAGVGVLELRGARAPVEGDLFALAQPVFFGLSYIRLGKVSRNFKGSAVAISAAQVAVVGLCSLIWAAVQSGGLDTMLASLAPLWQQPPLLTSIAYTGLITTSLSIILQTQAFSKVKPTDASVIISSEPLFAAMLSVLLLGESLGQSNFLGGALIIAACILSELGGSAPAENAESSSNQDVSAPSAERREGSTVSGEETDAALREYLTSLAPFLWVPSYENDDEGEAEGKGESDPTDGEERGLRSRIMELMSTSRGR
ncbi:unnamed protein product [Vitrella brassicaformis CCMP3155]|uniref:EamA domain-containing protein n=1 Tax=Vitrella brassicaformis (strain CCMP3155) TaxID=1169540 RepID=A0A0G4EX42_VITBC|nr:unnamed protein product [Vitrella brassicaformis CCMP3155]|eukprot:CEM03567.1 unnamed protein product [Vitrella brassicaformis CCMP3155]